MRLSKMLDRDIISAYDGCYLGSLRYTDIVFDSYTGKIISLIVLKPRSTLLFWQNRQEIVIPWHRVRKIGQNAILVDIFSRAELR